MDILTSEKTIEQLKEDLKRKKELLSQLVGTLYPSVLLNEINDLELEIKRRQIK